MSATSRAFETPEQASGLALQILEEMRMRVIECQVALQVVSGEAELNFDELDDDLDSVQRSLQAAYAATSLINQGAPLAHRWGVNWSRPRAVFARHHAAVRRGAERVDPCRSAADELERMLLELPPPDRIQHYRGPKPTCTAVVQVSGLKCSSLAAYLGSGLFASHCYVHATAHERHRYREHKKVVDAEELDLLAAWETLQQKIGERMIREWLSYAKDRWVWIEEAMTAVLQHE